MPKLQIEATELVNPDVNLVAMVKRGANRIPFRIVKEDTTDMIDLAKIGLSLFSKREKGPALVGVVLAKGADTAAISAAFQEAGVPMDKFTKAENPASVTLTKADASYGEDEVAVVKLSDEVAVVIGGDVEFTKSLSTYDWESTSFSEVMSKGAFAPSVCMAQDMLQRTFFNIMEKADTTADLTKMMKSAIGEFEAYVTTLAKGLPASVFKADIALQKAAKAKAKPAEKPMVEDTDMDNEKGGKAPAKKEEISQNPVAGNETKTQTGTKVANPAPTDNNIEGDPAAGNDTPKNPGTKPAIGTSAASNDVEGSSVTKSEGNSEVMAALAALTKALGDGLKEVRTHVDGAVNAVKTDVGAINDRVGKLADQVKKTDEALNGTVLGDANGERTGVQKGEEHSNVIPLIDTAFTTVDDDKRVA